jgi:signal transduction histidine kinase
MTLPRSYHVRVTLGLALLVTLSVVFLSLLFGLASYEVLKRERVDALEASARLLAAGVTPGLADDALWAVHSAVSRFLGSKAAADPIEVVVLDAGGRIYATSRSPERDWLMAPAAALGEGYAALQEPPPASGFTRERDGRLLAVAPVLEDSVALGTVALQQSLASLAAHVYSAFGHALWYSAAVLAALLALGGWLGRRMLAPLRELQHCLGLVGRVPPDEIHCPLASSPDEFGELAKAFEAMLAGLKERELLLERMVHSERLAAVGRFAAGIAHEMNNPIGGMLNALGTHQRHRGDPLVTQKTLDLVERGLLQVRQTLQALLVEARPRDSRLTRQDLEDIRTLVQGELGPRDLQLDWTCAVPERVDLPASQVRQVLLNVVLNAIQASPEGGRIEVHCVGGDATLDLSVQDEGPGIPPAQRARLFEPFSSGGGGSGLGLWVSYQIVSQLGGQIGVAEAGPGTRVRISLPLGAPA